MPSTDTCNRHHCTGSLRVLLVELSPQMHPHLPESISSTGGGEARLFPTSCALHLSHSLSEFPSYLTSLYKRKIVAGLVKSSCEFFHRMLQKKKTTFWPTQYKELPLKSLVHEIISKPSCWNQLWRYSVQLLNVEDRIKIFTTFSALSSNHTKMKVKE